MRITRPHATGIEDPLKDPGVVEADTPGLPILRSLAQLARRAFFGPALFPSVADAMLVPRRNALRVSDSPSDRVTCPEIRSPYAKKCRLVMSRLVTAMGDGSQACAAARRSAAFCATTAAGDAVNPDPVKSSPRMRPISQKPSRYSSLSLPLTSPTLGSGRRSCCSGCGD